MIEKEEFKAWKKEANENDILKEFDHKVVNMKIYRLFIIIGLLVFIVSFVTAIYFLNREFNILDFSFVIKFLNMTNSS